jgi:hypothetical protein
MARTALAVQDIGDFGGGIANITLSAANADGHSIQNDGDIIVIVKNTNAATRDITFVAVDDQFGRAEDIVLTCPVTSGHTVAGPFPKHLFNQAGGLLNVDFEAVVDVTVAALRISKLK